MRAWIRNRPVGPVAVGPLREVDLRPMVEMDAYKVVSLANREDGIFHTIEMLRVGVFKDTKTFGIVAAMDREFMGYGVIRWMPRHNYQCRGRIEVMELIVEPEHRSKGIGRAIMEELVLRASYEKVNLIGVTVRESDDRAIGFMKSAPGFRATHVVKGEFICPVEDGYRFVRDLDERVVVS